MASLFGPTPEEIMAAQRAQQEQSIQAQGQEFGIFRPLYQAGLRFGQAGTNAIVQGLFPEAADPALRKAQATQAILSKYQGQDLSDPSVLKQISSEFITAGVPEAGFKALTLAKELTPKRQFEKVDGTIVEITPQGVVPVYSAPTERFSTLSADEVKAQGLDPTRVWQRDSKTNKISQVGTGPAVSLDLAGVLDKFSASTEGKEKAQEWVKAGEVYRLSVPLVNQLKQAIPAAENAFTGAGAQGKLALSKALSAFGIPISDRATDTEFLDAMSSKLVQRIAKNFPGSQAIKELEQLIKSKPNLSQESGTVLRLLKDAVNEVQADVLTYEQMSRMDTKSRYAADKNIISADNYRALSRLDSIQAKMRSNTATREEALEAKSIMDRLGMK